MELGKAKDRAVRFSARNIQLINYYDVEGHDVHRGPKAFQQRSTYYVQNKSNSCKKVRVALSESSDPVSTSYGPTIVYTITILCLHL